ncbi:uncharacterized protein LOC129000306 [Macrosteles quadrilineatus]|uniref:uncharacterized protein LOC129000306 n=1 Tax=Macrosteles quadrilineatus TaxID=74068 RepID=UPI0023E25EB4|nr:uncharacterized protein LOC129000306 [Macrosteles quadrilineatus]
MTATIPTHIIAGVKIYNKREVYHQISTVTVNNTSSVVLNGLYVLTAVSPVEGVSDGRSNLARYEGGARMTRGYKLSGNASKPRTLFEVTALLKWLNAFIVFTLIMSH